MGGVLWTGPSTTPEFQSCRTNADVVINFQGQNVMWNFGGFHRSNRSESTKNGSIGCVFSATKKTSCETCHPETCGNPWHHKVKCDVILETKNMTNNLGTNRRPWVGCQIFRSEKHLVCFFWGLKFQVLKKLEDAKVFWITGGIWAFHPLITPGSSRWVYLRDWPPGLGANQLSHWNPGWFIGILIMAYCNPYIKG